MSEFTHFNWVEVSDVIRYYNKHKMKFKAVFAILCLTGAVSGLFTGTFRAALLIGVPGMVCLRFLSIAKRVWMFWLKT